MTRLIHLRTFATVLTLFVTAPTMAQNASTPPSGITGALPSASSPAPMLVSAWFNGLSAGNQHKFLAEAAKEGLVGTDGRAFTAGQFTAMSIFVDEELTRQGLSDADKRQVLHLMEQRAGILVPMQANPADTSRASN